MSWEHKQKIANYQRLIREHAMSSQDGLLRDVAAQCCAEFRVRTAYFKALYLWALAFCGNHVSIAVRWAFDTSWRRHQGTLIYFRRPATGVQ